MSFIKSQKFLYFSFAYALFIIYGSLVPLDYRPEPFDEAWFAFTQIRYLDLGAASRADWIANILLYIPLTFSLAAAFLSKVKSPPVQTFFTTALILIFSLALAITIEFYQQFFPPRTVSQNDLLAESIGSIIGLILWFGFRERLKKLYSYLLYGGREALLASAILYTLGYLAISFFPFDFVTSFQELQNKLSNGSDAFFISSSCGGLILCSTRIVVEVFLVIPLGIILSVLLRWHPSRQTAVILIGLILGAMIETIQLFLISGIAQGISIFTRILGLVIGEIIYQKISELKKPLITVDFKKYLIIASIPYILLLALLNGWTLSEQSITLPSTEKIEKINYLPFYYHYYSTEAVALTSLLSIFAMYLPVGLGVWLWNYNNKHSAFKITAGLFAVSLCLVMETGKLFMVGKHPDPTNLIISFASAFITYSIAELIYQWFHQSQNSNYSQYNEAISTYSENTQKTEQHTLADRQVSKPLAKSVAFVFFAFLFWKTTDYPGNSASLFAMLLLYGIVLYKFSHAWLIVIPALLPISDLAPWTGRIFFSEFDYFIILTLAISLWHGRWMSPFKIIKPGALFLLSLYAFFYIFSLIQGLLPWQTIDANSFTNYYSQYNSLRVGKGLIWAILLLPLLAYNQQNKTDIKKYFIYGVLAGLTITVLFGLWERYIFTGLFDYSSDFRITSTFYSMHTGGAHLDAYLLLSIPFICALLIQSKNILVRSLFTPVLFSISLYTLLVTYSRGTYIAFVFACITLLMGLFICYKKQIISHWKKTLWLPLFFVIVALVTTPVLKDSFIQNRFNQSFQEASFRSSHWLNAINMMDTDLLTSLFGMGVGSFPRTYLWSNFSDKAPAIFLVQQEQNLSYLQLGSGAPLYIEQIIDVSAFSTYKLNLDYRIHSNNSRLNISICEKAIQHSFNCQGIELVPQKLNTHWQHFEHTINTRIIGDNYRPIKLILHNNKPDSTIDVSNISLSSLNKNNLIKNGDFSKGMNHWFFTADEHIPWRTENLWVQIFFEQGWLGLITFILILLYAIIKLFRRLYKQDYFSAITLTSLAGFLVVGIIDSPFDTPNITLLFFMIIYISFIASKKRKKSMQLNHHGKKHLSRNP